MAIDFGKCLETLDVLSAGHVRKWLFLMAASQVDCTGLKAAAWRKVMWSLMRWQTRLTLFNCGCCFKGRKDCPESIRCTRSS